MDKILKAREHRNHLISSYKNPVILVKANIPGIDKNINEAYLLVRLFFIEINQKFRVLSFEFIESDDGPYYLIEILLDDMIQTKMKLIDIEEHHLLGRLIDLDLFDRKNKSSLSRKDLKVEDRKCYVCNHSARFCSRNQSHDINLLNKFIKDQVFLYLIQFIKTTIKEAMMIELELDHKFGLVTKTSSGSHHDMDYFLMIKAQEVILPFFMDLFELAYHHDDDYQELFKKAREIGKLAENKMLETTNQVNCYKGLIFVLGLFVISTAIVLSKHQKLENVFEYIKVLTKDINQDFLGNSETFGIKVYQMHFIKGVRGEAYLGFPTIKEMFNKYKNDQINDQMLRSALKDMILLTEDTVFLKRAKSYDYYLEVKKMIKDLNTNNLNEVISFTEYAIKNCLSFGGSADLLVSLIYLMKINEIL